MSDAPRPHDSHQADPGHPAPPAAPPLNIERPGDALALVQHTFGRLPADSLVIIGFRAGITGGHLRVDLASVRQRPEQMGEQCAEWIAGPAAEPVPNAAMALIFDTAPAVSDAADRYMPMLRALQAGLLERAEAPLVQVWHIEQGYIRDYHTGADKRSGGPSGEHAESALNQTLQRIPSLETTRARSPQEALTRFLAPNPLAAAEQQTRVRQHQAPPPTRGEAVIALWEAALGRSLREGTTHHAADAGWIHHSPEQAAALLRTLEDPDHVELLMALTVTNVEAVGRIHQRGKADPGAGALIDAAWGVAGAPPQWPRVESLVALLRQLLPYAQQLQRAQLLGLRAWVEWLRGSGSTASAFAETVREQHPELWRSTTAPPLARSVLACISALGVCPWAQDKASSYSWWSSRQ
ncbi:DUF4192 family protein [Nesterenkonia sphaerica]|uniref:DUF4192 family protein n=1 Tax=Nesterenkonia sphaerica TaxID=1804988 RepID=A0A5R9ANQ0_9MICC|nr:DUF4192 family protein [Nesterenkonia sphaerica]TLP79526.1 DUF4192 family protein [Nesterenkonia sphaerica]